VRPAVTPLPKTSNSNVLGVVPMWTTNESPSRITSEPRAGMTMRAPASASAVAMLSYGSAAVPVPSGAAGSVSRTLSTNITSSLVWNQNSNTPPGRPSWLPSSLTLVLSTNAVRSSGLNPNFSS